MIQFDNSSIEKDYFLVWSEIDGSEGEFEHIEKCRVYFSTYAESFNAREIPVQEKPELVRFFFFRKYRRYLRGGVKIVMMRICMHSYQNIISLENLFLAWEEFICGKKKSKDVIIFSLRLSENVFNLHSELSRTIYEHSDYEAFKISDPKPRDIHKATVRDRLLHHAIYRILYPYFEKRFIYDSYSCRDVKGTHRAMGRFLFFYRKVSKNSTRVCWVLKCDVRKFFASINHERLFEIIGRHDVDLDTRNLVCRVVESFNSGVAGTGLPLGNLTSQLLVNVYMNEFDQYIKHRLKLKYYIRFADDFVVLSEDKERLEDVLEKIKEFLLEKLHLSLHPDKVSIATFSSGIDFLGWIHLTHHRVLRTSTKRRMIKNMKAGAKPETVASYKGMLKHGNTYKLQQKVFKSDPDMVD